jgi:hypothetical protein
MQWHLMDFNTKNLNTARPKRNIMKKNCFHILSLDGGGIKGVFTAAVLAAIEEDTNTRIVDHFDMIVGTSTGGIIALGLGLGIKPKDLVNFYVKHGKKIFSNKWKYRSFTQWFYRKYPVGPLEEALRSEEVFGERTFGESSIPLIIPSYNLGENDIYLFKTPHSTRYSHDWKIPAWKIALATSAAPTYFPASNNIDSIHHIDGGMWANNPSMVGIVEAVTELHVNLDKIRLLSIGTSTPLVKHPRLLFNTGRIPWAMYATSLVIHAQSRGAHTQVQRLLTKDNVIRLNPKVPDNLFSLDGSDSINELLSKAAHESRYILPRYRAEYMNHNPKHYEPCYRA